MEAPMKCVKPLSVEAPFGFLYVASGKQYVDEAVESLRTLRAQHPSAKVAAVLSHWELPEASEFDCVFALENPEYNSNDKIAGILCTPFPKTVFLDTDTLILEPLDDLEQLLDHCEFAMVRDPIWETYPQPDIPESFPTFNSGVIAFQRSKRTEEFLLKWLAAFRSQVAMPGESLRDQPPLRRVLYESDMRVMALPLEYNLRVIYPYLVGGNARIKVLHGRQEYLERALNHAGTRHKYPRVFGRNFGTAELGKMFLRQLWTRLCARLALNRLAVRKRKGVTGK